MRWQVMTYVVLLCSILGACEEETGVYILFDAGNESRRRGESLTVHVCNQEGELIKHESFEASAALTSRLPLAPKNGDHARVFAVVSELTGGDGRPFNRQTLAAGYKAGEIRELTVAFDDECINAFECDFDETCNEGTCVDARESQELLIRDALPCGDDIEEERGVLAFRNVAVQFGLQK